MSAKKEKNIALTSEEKELLRAMSVTNGNKAKAAEMLGIKKTTFRDKLDKLQNKNKPTKKDNKAVLIESALAKTHGNKTKAAELLGMARTTFRDTLDKFKDDIQGFYRKLPKKEIYVITSAQNATPVNDGFLESLKRYCEYRNAELVVIPLRYKNPSNVFSMDLVEDDWWDEKLVPYLCDTRTELNKNLILFADIKIQPTASNPLSGFDALGRDKSVILGHTKLMLKTVPVPNHATPKILTTTGSVTKSNYSETKAGKKGDFHHSYSAIVVELDENMFHMRQLNSIADGSFIDLNYEYTPTEVREAPPAEALIMGDLHAQFVDPDVIKATFTDKESIVKLLSPKYLVLHDSLDFYSRNHHHKNNPFVDYAKHISNLNDVRKEIELTFNLINEHASDLNIVFPASNHPEALGKWIKEADWKTDPVNAEFYLETALYMLKGTKMGESGSTTPDPFAYWGGKLLKNPKKAIFLSRDESFEIRGIDVGAHGHYGPNGARGSIENMSKIGTKTVIGHSHSPKIFDGSIQVGTSSKYRLEYNVGPSSWLHSGCIIYGNGKRTLINIINGEYKL